jgi:hypothetical protein
MLPKRIATHRNASRDFVAAKTQHGGSTPRFDAYEETGSRVSCRHCDGVGLLARHQNALADRTPSPRVRTKGRFASEKRLIEPPRDLVAQGYELRRCLRRARARDGNVGENARRTDR